jgi:phosphoribosyl-dephospho-CoA transferase
LIKPSTSETENGDSYERRQRRKKALMRYLDQRLVCVCLRLPGVIYTIEINPETEEVVHWEWQTA